MLKNLPIALLGLVLLGIIGVSCYTNPPDEEQKGSANNNPPAATVSESQHTQSSQHGHTPSQPPYWRRLFLWPGGVEALAVSATLFFIGWQALLTRQAIASAETASQVELRAYLVVAIAGGNYQDREKEVKFGGRPALSNSGKTPAHNVRYRTNSAILTDEASRTHSFPPGDEEIGNYGLTVGGNFSMGITHSSYCDAKDVPAIMAGDKIAFYYWGLVQYDDAFGNPQKTEFCHRLNFSANPDKEGDWKVNGHYVIGRNNAT